MAGATQVPHALVRQPMPRGWRGAMIRWWASPRLRPLGTSPDGLIQPMRERMAELAELTSRRWTTTAV